MGVRTRTVVVVLASWCAWGGAAVPRALADDVPELQLSLVAPLGDAGATTDVERADDPSEDLSYAFSVGLDLYTRFIWRGVSFGDQWTLQPNASFTTHGFSVNVWASAAPNQASLVDYVGITLGYAYEASFGTFTVQLADWIFTQRYASDGTLEAGAPYLFDFEGGGNGSHWLDLTVSYAGPQRFPLTVQLGAVIYNDPDHSLYAGLLYRLSLGAGFTLTPELGVVFGRSRLWYRTNSDPVNLTNCALTLARSVELGRGVTLPASVALIVNPDAQQVYVVASVGLRL